MDFTQGVRTLFAVLVPMSQFEYLYPAAMAFLALCAGAWFFIAFDMRRWSRRGHAHEIRPTSEIGSR